MDSTVLNFKIYEVYGEPIMIILFLEVRLQICYLDIDRKIVLLVNHGFISYSSWNVQNHSSIVNKA